MTLHDLIAELEAEFASLFARFRSHPTVQAAATPPVVAVTGVSVNPGGSIVVAAPAAPVPPSQDITHLMLGAEAAGKPQEVAQAPASTSAVDLSAPVLDFNQVVGQNIMVSGSASKKFTNCPTPVWVQTINGSGSTITANDQSRTEPNGQALNRLTVTPINGEVNVTVVCDDGGRTDLSILAGPQ